jgi:nitroreductase
VGEFFEAVQRRRTIRDFLADPIPDEVLERCLEAARLAPSSSNLQPWEFVLIRDAMARAEANRICLDQLPTRSAPLLLAVVAHRDTWRRNRDKILRTHEGRGPLRTSMVKYYRKLIPLIYITGPFGVLGVLKRAVSRVLSLFKPTPSLQSRTDLRILVHKSTALAASTFMTALSAEGWDSCPMEGFDPWRARKLLGLASGAEVCMFIAVGRRSPKGLWWERALLPEEWVVRTI